jgi:glycosyltransferase involved in cell wall biosynthesis
MFTLCKVTRDPSVHAYARPLLLAKILWRLISTLNGLPIRGYPLRPLCGWTASRVPIGAVTRIRRLKPDIVHLHLFDCLLRYRDIPRLPGRVCWTFHDMGCITGGCHCTPTCQQYTQRCGKCPELGSSIENDASRLGWRDKSKAWQRSELTAICPSTWLHRETVRSPMCANHRVKHIPNGVPVETFTPSLRNEARNRLGFKGDRFYLLAGSTSLKNILKGFQFIKDMAPALSHEFPEVDLVLFGHGEDGITELPVHRMGFISAEQQMAALFAACDGYILPTLVDNLPNTLIESIACGTPCVTFNVGGCPDVVRDGATGWIAREQTAESLIEAVRQLVRAGQHELAAMREKCRAVALAEYDQTKQAVSCVRLYEELLATTSS